MKKIVVLFDAPGFTADDYDQTWEELRAAGQSRPKGLISHVGFVKPNGNWNVVDVWESAEAFEEFSKILIPIIQKTKVEVPPPMILPAHFAIYKNQPEEVVV
jgi:hypothetical protein